MAGLCYYELKDPTEYFHLRMNGFIYYFCQNNNFHPQQFQEWQLSTHYRSTNNPIFQIQKNKAKGLIEEIENQSFELTNKEDDDIAISSFSPQVIEVINEEEEKVA